MRLGSKCKMLSMIRFDGDIRTAQEFMHHSGEPEVYLKKVLPSNFAVVSTPMDSFYSLRLAKLPERLRVARFLLGVFRVCASGMVCRSLWFFAFSSFFFADRQHPGCASPALEQSTADRLVASFSSVAPLFDYV